jgi:PAS domain S-box-containing protein
MNESFFLGLVYNASLLLAMVLVFDLTTTRLNKNRSVFWKIIAGIILGGIGLAVMSTNWELLPGVAFDTRSVLLGVTGLFFGWVPTLITLLMTAAYRIYQGGVGMLMGVPVIIVSSLIGLVWRICRGRHLHSFSLFELYIFGLSVHIGMLLCTFLLPIDIRGTIQTEIWLPVITIYPLATLMLGALLSNRLRRDLVVQELETSENNYRLLIEQAIDGVFVIDSEGKFLISNNEAKKMLGYSDEEMKTLNIIDTYLPEEKAIAKERLNKLRLGTDLNFTRKALRKDGSVFLVEARGRKLSDGRMQGFMKDITQQNMVVEALKESEEKFSKVFETSPYIIIMTKAENGEIVEVNDTFEMLSGYSRKEALASSSVMLKLWANIEDRQKAISELKSGQKIISREYPFRKKNGEVLTGSFSAQIIQVKGAPYIVSAIEDISEKKKIEKELVNLATFPRLNPNCIIEIDAKGEVTYSNPACSKKSEETGIEVNEMLPKDIDKIFQTLQQNQSKVLEIENTIKGKIFLMVINYIKETDRIRIYAMDISERKRAEAELARVNMEVMSDKQRMEAILRDMGDAVFVTDNEKNIAMANKAMEGLFGMREIEMLGKNIEQVMNLYYESSGEKPKDLIETVFEKKKPARPKEILVLSKKSGDKLFVDGVATPIIDINSKLVGTVWVFRDVTKEREVDKMKTDFISLASHQLRTPLTGIKWFVELLEENKEKLPKDRISEYIRRIGQSSDRMIELVNDLLATSRADNGKLEKEMGSYPARELLQQAIDEQGRIFTNKNIKIVGLNTINPEWELEADMVQMSQVFGNLFNNAASYSPANSVIEVGGEQVDGMVKIFVKDSGLGIPKEQQEKVFGKFFRADNVAKTIPGSGLGLYVAKSMVESHGGKIWFESKENLGTTFFVELPIKQKKDGQKKESDDRGG